MYQETGRDCKLYRHQQGGCKREFNAGHYGPQEGESRDNFRQWGQNVPVKGILKGTGSTQTASASVNGSSFSLKGSKVDGGLKFGKLGVGSGSIRLEVMVQVSYIGTNNKIVPANGTIILPEVKFTVKK